MTERSLRNETLSDFKQPKQGPNNAKQAYP